MNNRSVNSRDDVFSELLRRGLPADYARRAASEIADHHRDLIDELEAAGMSEPQAVTEASRRLGEPRTLIKKTVGEYQRRFWCARWPLITFLLVPVPLCIAAYIATCLVLIIAVQFLATIGVVESSDFHVAKSMAPFWLRWAIVIWLFVGTPTLVTFGIARLAKRAALGWPWVVLAACLVGFTVGAIRMQPTGLGTGIYTVDPETMKPLPNQRNGVAVNLPLIDPNWWYRRTGWRRWYGGHPMQACQFLLPLAAAGVVLVRARQLALRAQRLALDGS